MGDAETAMRQRAKDVHQRLFYAAPKEAAPATVERPISPFSRERMATDTRRKLFTRAIIELDPIPYDSSLFMPKWKQIALEVGAKHDVSLLDLRSPRRDKRVVIARHECFWRCSKETVLSLPQIGRFFGDRDHTTVMHGIKKHEQRTAAQ